MYINTMLSWVKKGQNIVNQLNDSLVSIIHLIDIKEVTAGYKRGKLFAYTAWLYF